MQEQQDNIKKTDFGYEIIWSKNDEYGAKIVVFESPNKTNFSFHKETEKSWFVNGGQFIFRWIDTATGNIYQQEATDGYVFTAKPLVPYALECVSNGGSLSEVNNGHKENDTFVVLTKENYK